MAKKETKRKGKAPAGAGAKGKKKKGSRSCPPGCKCGRHKNAGNDPDRTPRKQTRTKVAQAEFLRALRYNLGVIQPALDASNVSRKTYRRWMNNPDDDFAERFADVQSEKNDFVESKLLRHINADDLEAIKFYLDRRHPGFMDPRKANQIPLIPGQNEPPAPIKFIPASTEKKDA